VLLNQFKVSFRSKATEDKLKLLRSLNLAMIAISICRKAKKAILMFLDCSVCRLLFKTR
jgi:hypothetical protein